MKSVDSFVPLYDNILVSKHDGEKKTDSGIILPGSDAGKSYTEGYVVKVGEGFKLPDGGIRPLKVNIGDTIIFRKMTEILIELSGKQYYVVSEANVIGIL